MATEQAEFDKVLLRLDNLPTIPLVAQRISDLVSDPHVDAQRIGSALKSDQSLTAKVLKLANSPYYAIPGGVSDVTRAISFLGFNTLQQLVLSVSVLSIMDLPKASGLAPRELWKHALACGVLADHVGKRLNLSGKEACFSAGLLHDIGKVALLQIATGEFQQAVVIARTQNVSLQEAEARVSLPPHDNVGLRLAERWRLPMPIRAAIQRRRFLAPDADAVMSPALRSLRVFADITLFAETSVRRLQIGDAGDDAQPEVDASLLTRLNLTERDAEALRSELMRSLEKSAAFLELVK